MEMNGAKYHHNEGPRELEIFSDEQVEEVMESLEYFKTKIEQLQLYCEQVNRSKLRSDEAVLEQKRKHQAEISKCQEEVNVLRSINIQLMSGKVASAEKRGNFSVSSLSCAIDSENAESRIQEMESKVRCLELALAEKEKHVSVMEWQIMDMEATIAALQAERDQLVLELELHDAHENVLQGNEHYRTMGGESGDTVYEEHEPPVEPETLRKKPRNPRRPHSDLLGSAHGQESLALKQLLSLSADWSSRESPQRMRKPPQRHYSDYVKRDSRARNTDFSRNTTHSLEDFDNLSEVDSGLGLGKLTRTTNFCDILDADEYSNFHVADNRLSFTGDSVLTLEQGSSVAGPESETSQDLLAKKWEAFEIDAQNGESTDVKVPVNESDNARVSQNNQEEEPFANFNAFDEQSLGSSTSDFSSAFHSSQDILVSSTEEPWTSSSAASCSAIPKKSDKKKLTKKDISKSDSCISSARLLPSDKDDMWNFTPDSILNVSTGEIFAPSVVETLPTPSLKKSRSFTSSVEIVLKPPKAPKNSTKSDEKTDGIKYQVTTHTVDHNGQIENKPETPEGCKSDLTSFACADCEVEPVTLRDSSGENLRAKHHGKSKSACVSSESSESPESDVTTVHQKSLSDPVKEGDDGGRRKLLEYQKWRKYGRRGKPPGDLKISDC